MGLLFKIIGLLTLGIFFIIVVFSSFIQTDNVSVQSGIINFSGSILGSGSIIQDDISEFETIYSLGKGYLQEEYEFTFEASGKYLSSLRDIKNSYSLTSTGFTIRQQGIGDVYVDSITTPGKTFVYAMNSPITITLHDDTRSEDYVDIYLAPHMYLEFQANRGRYLKNADRLRISTVFKLGYIGKVGEYSLQQEYIKKYFHAEDDFFTIASQGLINQDTKKRIALNEFRESSVSQISRLDFIQRYLHLFVNNEKKKVFYKNLVLSGYKELLQSEKMDEDLIRNIKKDLESLQNIDQKSYDEMLELKSNIVALLYSSNSEEYIISKIAFSFLEEGDVDVEKVYFPLYGFALFSSYDAGKIFSNELSEKFIQSFHLEDASLGQTDYFLYYLEQQLLFLLEKSQEDLFDDSSVIFHTLESYGNITNNLEYSQDTQKVTRLFVISNILKNIDIFMRTEYFLIERNEDGILLLDSSNKIVKKDLDSLNNSIILLYNIFRKDQASLNPDIQRDILISDDIISLNMKLEEYFAALENYSSYQDKYDTLKSNSLNLDTFSSANDTDLSLEKIQDYLSGFVGISFANADIDIVDDYYKINNIIISGRAFSFDLYPESLNKMGNIVIDEQRVTSQYKLSIIESEWQEKYETAAKEEKERFNFQNFFLLTFFSNQSENIEEFIVSESEQQEDKAEVVFKKDILLGTGGEFESISNILNIGYEDIKVEKSGDHYDILLDNINFVFQNINEGESGNISGILTSEYVLNNVDHYFKNIQIQIKQESRGENNNYFFSGNPVLISGKIHIADISQELEKITSDVYRYSNIFEKVKDIVADNFITLQYTTFNQKLSLKFDYEDKKYNILLTGGEIESIYRGTQKIVSSAIDIEEISNYIQ